MEASEGTAGAQPTGSSTRQPAPDERYHPCPAGRHWGPNGAAGVLPWTVTPDGRAWVLPSRRSPHVQAGGTWSTFGGAIDGGETPWHAAVRETSEEIDGIDVRLGVVAAELEVPCEHGCGWTYTTFAADEFRRPAHVCQMAGPGEAVAGTSATAAYSTGSAPCSASCASSRFTTAHTRSAGRRGPS